MCGIVDMQKSCIDVAMFCGEFGEIECSFFVELSGQPDPLFWRCPVSYAPAVVAFSECVDLKGGVVDGKCSFDFSVLFEVFACNVCGELFLMFGDGAVAVVEDGVCCFVAELEADEDGWSCVWVVWIDHGPFVGERPFIFVLYFFKTKVVYL